jgi:acetyltransferase
MAVVGGRSSAVKHMTQPSPTRSVHDALGYERATLDAFFAPRSIALIGATEEAGSAGLAILRNLRQGRAQVYAVNPYHATVDGLATYSTVGAIGSAVDLAVVVTPAATVPSIIAECVTANVRAAIVISAGFRERGPDGAALEQAMLDQARRGRLRVLGPNCLGIIRPASGLNTTFLATPVRAGGLALISQSGALGAALLDWGAREHIGFSAFVSVGSMMDLDWGDLLDYLGDDPATKAMVLAMESVGDARSFLSAAREVAFTKPIIVIKAGRTSEAARAAAAHVGVDVGSDAVLDAAFRRCGVLRIETLGYLFAMVDTLSKQPRPQGPRLLIVTNAGGLGVLATDTLVEQGGTLAALSPTTLAALDAVLPAHWSRANPIDILGDADAERWERALQIIARDGGYDGVLVIFSPQGTAAPDAVAQYVVRFAEARKPWFASWMGGEQIAAAEEILNQANIPALPYPDTAARMFCNMWRYTYDLRALYETPSLPPEVHDVASARAAAEHMIRDVCDGGRTHLALDEAAQLLAAYDIPPALGTASTQQITLSLRSDIDAQFGPVLRCGLGGTLGAVFDDDAVALPPLNTTLARRMLEHLPAYRAIRDGAVPFDPAPLEQTLVRFSRLVVEQRRVREIVLDPLEVCETGVVVRGARMLLHDRSIADADMPRSAIRPYPVQYVAPWTLRDGTAVTIRPIRAEDEPLMVAFHHTLSEGTVYTRYFSQLKLDQRIAHERLTRICFIDYDREMALVAERDDGVAGRTIVGVGRLSKLRGTSEAEFAILIADQYQHQGLGSELLRRLIAVGRDEGVSAIVAEILPENMGMRRVVERLGFKTRTHWEDNVTQARLAL